MRSSLVRVYVTLWNHNIFCKWRKNLVNLDAGINCGGSGNALPECNGARETKINVIGCNVALYRIHRVLPSFVTWWKVVKSPMKIFRRISTTMTRERTTQPSKQTIIEREIVETFMETIEIRCLYLPGRISANNCLRNKRDKSFSQNFVPVVPSESKTSGKERIFLMVKTGRNRTIDRVALLRTFSYVIISLQLISVCRAHFLPAIGFV